MSCLLRIVAITPHCGCGNPGSIPGGDIINYSIIMGSRVGNASGL
jgi:hypothetical protein